MRQFLERNKLSLIVRAHEVRNYFSRKRRLVQSYELRNDVFQLVKKGYEISSGKQLITIFSAPNYTGIFGNNGAIMSVTENYECYITALNVSKSS